jgi:hypothetical protein
MKVVMFGCDKGIKELEVSFNDSNIKCTLKTKHNAECDGSNFEVANPGHSLFIV